MRYQIVRRGSSGFGFGAVVRNFSVEGSGTEWTSFAMPFASGEVPAGHELAVETLAGTPVSSQGPVATTHANGTCKHAFISARVTGGSSYRVVTAAPSTPALTVADLLAAVPGDIARIDLSAGVTGVMTARDLLTSATNRARLNNTSSYVIVAQGANVLDLWLAQDFDTHFRWEMQLRWYGGTLLWADPIVYCGYVNLNGMGSRTCTTQFTLNGVVKDTRSGLTHFNRSMKHGGYWTSGGALYVRQVASELIASRALPNYSLAAPPSDAFLNAQIQSVGPYQTGDLATNLGGTGSHAWIGIDTMWGSAFITSNCKKRAYDWMLANSDAAMGYNFSSLLDSATGEMLSISDRPTFTGQSTGLLGSGYTSGLSPNGNSSTGQPASHSMAAGYMAYLVTGQVAYLKSLHGWASFETFWTDSNRNHTYNAVTVRKGYYGSIRGVAWQYRSVGQAAYITPDWHCLKAYFSNTVNGNFLKDAVDFGSSYSSIGVVDGSEPITQYRTFMHFFLAQSTAYLVCDLGFENGRTFAVYVAKLVAGLMGNTGEYNWCFATAQDRAVAATDGAAYYTTFTEMNNDTRNVPAYATALVPGSQACANAMFSNGDIASATAGTMTGHPESATGYPSNIRPAVSYLAALGVTGAAACYAHLNQGIQPDYSEEPQFNILPR